MGVTDFLKGFTPEINDDGDDFDVLKGTYQTKINKLVPDKNRDGVYDRYTLELEVTDVLEGNGGVGRRIWRRYYKDNADSMKKLVNDLFTAGIEVDTSSDQAFEDSLMNTKDKAVTIRAWGWQPDKTVDGKPIPEGEKRNIQQFVVKNPAKAGSKKAKANAVPF